MAYISILPIFASNIRWRERLQVRGNQYDFPLESSKESWNSALRHILL